MSKYLSLNHTTSWPEGNFTDPESRADSLRAGLISSLALAAIMMSIRLYTRVFIVRTIGLDDLLILLAMMISIGAFYVGITALSDGWGLHMWDIDPKRHGPTRRYIYFAQASFIPIVYLTKISILYSYIRIAPNPQFRYRVQFLLALLICSFIATFVPTLLQCIPISAFWTMNVSDARCLDWGMLYMITGGLNSLFDVAVAILPAPMLWKARLPKKERGGLVVLFAVGGMVCVIGVVRIVTMYDALYNEKYDFSWSGAMAGILGMVECNVGIVAACLPALRPFWSRYVKYKLPLSQNVEELSSESSRKDVANEAAGGVEKKTISGAVRDVELGDVDAETRVGEGKVKTGAFSYAATTGPTKSKRSEFRDSINSLRSGALSPISTKSPWRSMDAVVKKGRRSSGEPSSSTGGTMTEVDSSNGSWRASTGRTWLSLEEEEEDDEYPHSPPGHDTMRSVKQMKDELKFKHERRPSRNIDLLIQETEKALAGATRTPSSPSQLPTPPSQVAVRRERSSSVTKSEGGFSYAATATIQSPIQSPLSRTPILKKLKNDTDGSMRDGEVEKGGGFSYAATSAAQSTPTSPPPALTVPNVNFTTAILSNATAAAAPALKIPLTAQKHTSISTLASTTTGEISSSASDIGHDDTTVVVESPRARWYGLASAFGRGKAKAGTFQSTETFKLERRRSGPSG